MKYDDAIAYWFGRINYESRSANPHDLKLERMCILLQLLGNPHERLRIIHIAGTKGKGSTAAMLASILQHAGYRVGVLTSPHMVHVEERIQIDGVKISRNELTHLLNEVRVHVDRLDQEPLPGPTFFEINTALAFLHFLRRRVDIAIIEVGLGGRFDSTNVCHPLVSVITSIGHDHIQQLGSTLESIAFQKAGIIKAGVPIVSGVSQLVAQQTIQAVAESVQVPVIQAEVNRIRELAMLGPHQQNNAAVASATIEVLRQQGWHIPNNALESGLRSARIPARIEVIRRLPTVILDCGHNVPSIEALIATLQEDFPTLQRRWVVLACSVDKQYREMVRCLADYFTDFILTRYLNNPRSLAPEQLVDLLKSMPGQCRYEIQPTPQSAWNAALLNATQDELICITGSMFLAGELMHVVYQHTL